MSPRASYLRVRNWDRFQHYSDRRPPWIKLHVELLDKHETMALPVATRWLAISLLLLAARTENVIDMNVTWLARVSNLTPKQIEVGLRDLLQCRFVEPMGKKRAASTTQAEGLSSRARTRSASVSSSVSEEQPQAKELMAYYCERVTRNGDVLTSRVRGMTAREIGKLVKEGIAAPLIRRALELQADKGKHPTILPSLVQEAQAEERPSANGKHGLTAAQILALPVEETL